MYLVDEIIDINWALYSEPGKVLSKDLFDVITISPAGVSTYHVDPMINWIMPYTQHGEACNNVDIVGNATYAFTAPPDSPGRWKILLVTGTADDYELLDKVHIYTLCDLTTTPTELTALATRHPQARPFCGVAPIILMENLVRWASIDSVGKGPYPNTVIISGTKTSFNLSTDIGIISTIDGSELAYYPSALLAVPYQASSCRVECDPETGLCFIGTRSYYFGGNQYRSYWTTDFINYTQCTGMNTSQGVLGVWHDSNVKTWFMQYFGDTWVSLEGKHWVEQDYERKPGGAIQSTTQLNDFLHTGMYKEGDTQWAFAANHAERGFHIKNDGSPSAPMSTLEFLQDFSIDDSPFFGVFWGGNPNNPGLDSVVGWEGKVYMMSTKGQICRSENPESYGGNIAGGWVAIAADQANADTNELLDIPFSTWRSFCVINDVFWVCRDQGGANKWYRYGTGGEPVGHGWVIDNTGPFGIRRIRSDLTHGFRKRWPEQRHVQIFDNVTNPPYNSYLLFDIGLNL